MNLWTDRNYQALRLVISELRKPREVAKELEITYHAIYTLLNRSRILYFVSVTPANELGALKADATRLSYFAFREKYRGKIYAPLLKDLVQDRAAFIQAASILKGDAKSKIQTVSWRCPECHSVSVVLSTKLKCENPKCSHYVKPKSQ